LRDVILGFRVSGVGWYGVGCREQGVVGFRVSGVEHPMGMQSKPFFWSADWITCPSHRVYRVGDTYYNSVYHSA